MRFRSARRVHVAARLAVVLLASAAAPRLAAEEAPELGLMEKLVARVPRGRYVLIPTGPETRGHGTHSLPDVWGEHLARFLAEIGDEAASRPR